MNPGELQHRITLQAPDLTQDAEGGISGNWIFVANLWARVMDISGTQFVASQSEQNAVEAKIKIRYRDGITAGMRVVHDGNIYDILAVLDAAGQKIELMLMCKKGVSNG